MKRILLFLFLCTQFVCHASENSQKYRILVGSPVSRKPTILKEFLESLKRLDKDFFTLDYFFIDDNNVEESSKLLQEFTEDKQSNYLILSTKNDLKYDCDNVHHWNEKLVWKVAGFKNLMIQKALTENYDYLFLIDSDIVLHPKTIKQLLKAKKDIISNIFWTRKSQSNNMPQVWLYNIIQIHKQKPTEKLTQEEITKRRNDFLNLLRQPGTHEVGGLGACTLISRAALKKGVSFQKFDNLSIWGEDRHFCIRAVALGFSLFVDTHYPAYHIFRESHLAGLGDFKKNIYNIK